jgi:diamine N-acetyltransferase
MSAVAEPGILLREAVAADAAALAALAARTFAETFADVTPPQDLAAFLAATYGVEQQGAEIADPEVATVLAVDGEAIVGFVQVRRGVPPPCVPAEGAVELGRLYVDGPHHGRGVAGLLMEEAVRRARTAHACVLWLGVFEHNLRARRFYAKWGFRDAGEHVFMVGADAQRDVIMAKPLPVGG